MRSPVCILAALLIAPVMMASNKPASRKTTISLERQVDALFRDYDGPDVPGASVLIVMNGKVLYKKAYGMADIENRIRTMTRTNYRIASMTKQFTAMAIMILADRGKLSFDDQLTKFFSHFPAYGRSITVRHLLNHTSGLVDYFDIIPADRTTPLKDSDVLDLLKQQDHTEFQPGSRFHYCNAGYVILALIVDKVSGVRFPDFLQKNIFGPLRMTSTRFYPREDHGDRHRAYGYSRVEGRALGFSQLDTEFSKLWASIRAVPMPSDVFGLPDCESRKPPDSQYTPTMLLRSGTRPESPYTFTQSTRFGRMLPIQVPRS